MKKTAIDFKPGYVFVVCEICDRKFKAATRTRRYCFDCRVGHKKEMQREKYNLAKKLLKKAQGRKLILLVFI